jgi:putative transposase
MTGPWTRAPTRDFAIRLDVLWQERRRRRALEKRLARQCRGSTRRARTVAMLGALRGRVARRRSDALHKLSRRLATQHSVIAIEKLDVKAMTRTARGTLAHPGKGVRAKAGLNREILERGWGALRRQLAYKTRWYGATLVEVDPRNTSRTCSACQSVDPKSRESQARFRCRACGHSDHADINAARVILARALERTAEGPSVAARGGLAVGRPVKREPPLRAMQSGSRCRRESALLQGEVEVKRAGRVTDSSCTTCCRPVGDRSTSISSS